MMCFIKVRRQAERAGIAPTLSVSVARGVASEEMDNQLQCNISQDYPYNDCSPSVNFPLYHVITSPLPVPRLEAVSEITRIIIP
jgi:hypothetical protein